MSDYCPVCNPEPDKPKRRQQRLSVSLPAHYVAYVRETAKARGVPASRVVSEALIHLRHQAGGAA